MDLQKTMEAIENFDDMKFHETISELVSYSFRLSCVGAEIQLGVRLGPWTYAFNVERYKTPIPDSVADCEVIKYFLFDMRAHRNDTIGSYDRQKVRDIEELLSLMKYAENEPDKFVDKVKIRWAK